MHIQAISELGILPVKSVLFVEVTFSMYETRTKIISFRSPMCTYRKDYK